MTSSSVPYAILLVDDNVHGLVARQQTLLDLGYDVDTAGCAEEAWQIIQAEKKVFHAVVTDYRMIAMDGLELIAKIRKAYPETKTVLLSGFVDALGLTAESTGADAVVSKSATELDQLARTLKKLFGKRTLKKPATSQSCSALTLSKSV
jgi:CheY-like chemotaxis protein